MQQTLRLATLWWNVWTFLVVKTNGKIKNLQNYKTKDKNHKRKIQLKTIFDSKSREKQFQNILKPKIFIKTFPAEVKNSHLFHFCSRTFSSTKKWSHNVRRKENYCRVFHTGYFCEHYSRHLNVNFNYTFLLNTNLILDCSVVSLIALERSSLELSHMH